jgi:RimJ/RimL family protein N-acetyltransferase
MVCWIRRIAVVPEMQGKGVSLEICKHCFGRGKTFGSREIYAFVERNNIKSKRMVTILGFEVDKESDDAIYFKKAI